MYNGDFVAGISITLYEEYRSFMLFLVFLSRPT